EICLRRERERNAQGIDDQRLRREQEGDVEPISELQLTVRDQPYPRQYQRVEQDGEQPSDEQRQFEIADELADKPSADRRDKRDDRAQKDVEYRAARDPIGEHTADEQRRYRLREKEGKHRERFGWAELDLEIGGAHV